LVVDVRNTDKNEDNMEKKLWKACLLGSVLILVCSSVCGALEFGSKVMKDDVDINNHLTAIPAYKLMYWDVNSNAAYDRDDVVYLVLDLNPVVDANDFRLSPFGPYRSGTQVKSGDIDFGRALSPFGTIPGFVFADLDGIPGYNLEDSVYLIIDSTKSTTSINDIRLTDVAGLAAGTKVLDSHRDLGDLVKPLPCYISFYNTNGNTNALPDDGDLLYLDTDLNGYVSVNDVRISA
jgi:hypothetical protein